MFSWSLWLALATAANLGRHPGGRFWESIWAEDGHIFLNDALNGAFFDVLNDPVAGYMHMAPRIAAEFVGRLPVEWAPAGLAGLASAVTALISVYVFWASADRINSYWGRLLLAAMTALLPAAALEASANVANLRLYLVWAAFWAVVRRAASRPAAIVDGFVVFVAALSDPLPLLLVPLAILSARGASSPWWWLTASSLLAAAAGQFAVMFPTWRRSGPRVGEQHA